MRTRIVSFIAGTAFALALLTWCGAPSHSGVAGSSPDGGMMTGPGGMMVGPGGPAMADQNGSRLKQIVYTGSDGTSLTSGWTDTQLGVECFMAPAADGTQRCLPAWGTFTSPPAVLWTPGSYYADPECVTNAVIAGSEPHYVLEENTLDGGCASFTWRVYAVNGATDAGPFVKTTYLNLPDGGYWESPDGGPQCVSASPANNPCLSSAKTYAVGDEVPPSTFVQFTRQQ